MTPIPDDPLDLLTEWDDQIYKVYGDMPDADRKAIKRFCLIVTLAGLPCDPLLLLSGLGVPKPPLLDNLKDETE
jgi:hypothetical protein